MSSDRIRPQGKAAQAWQDSAPFSPAQMGMAQLRQWAGVSPYLQRGIPGRVSDGGNADNIPGSSFRRGRKSGCRPRPSGIRISSALRPVRSFRILLCGLPAVRQKQLRRRIGRILQGVAPPRYIQKGPRPAVAFIKCKGISIGIPALLRRYMCLHIPTARNTTGILQNNRTGAGPRLPPSRRRIPVRKTTGFV